MKMPYQTDDYRRYDGPESKYYYGRRAGYAPYEIFYKEPPAAQADTTFLAVARKGYPLSELMDEPQKIWFPIFIEETVEKFFHTEGEPDADEWVLPEETEAVIPSCYGQETRAIVPVFSGLPAMPQYTYEIKGPEEVFGERYMQELCGYFGVCVEDILEAPVLPMECDTLEAYKKMIEEKIKKAYGRTLAERIADFLEGKWEARGMALDRIAEEQDRIIREAAEGRYVEFMSVIVDGTSETDQNGEPVMVKKKSGPVTFPQPSFIPSSRIVRKASISGAMLRQRSFGQVIFHSGKPR